MQGCINGYGERCGNANLASVIANLELKLGYETIGPDKLQGLTSVARYIAELANLQIPRGQAYVGQSAFAHKGGIHVSAVLKDSTTYEHIAPELVGNRQRVLVSDLSGRSNVDYMLREYDSLAGRLDNEARRALVDRVKEAEYQGYDLEAADGTFELFIRQALYPGVQFFDVQGYEVMIVGGRAKSTRATATVSIGTRSGDSIETAHGQGPVNALDTCLRKCLAALPGISEVRLTDYKVRILDSEKGHSREDARTGGVVRQRPQLVHRRRFRRRDRSQLGSAGERPAAGTDAAARNGCQYRQDRRRLLLDRVSQDRGGANMRRCGI